MNDTAPRADFIAPALINRARNMNKQPAQAGDANATAEWLPFRYGELRHGESEAT